MPNQLAVSVIVPTHNRSRFVVEAVRSLLDQSYPSVEIVVVDDGSTDDTQAALAPFADRIRLITQENAGPAAARNKGIAAASGEIVTFLDSDDLFLPDTLSRQLALPLGENELRFCKMRFEGHGGDEALVAEVVGDGIPWPACDEAGWLIDPLLELGKGGYLQLNGLVCRKSVFARVGPFDPGYRAGEDEEWFYRAALKLPMRLNDDHLAVRRIHDAQTGLHREDSLHSLVAVLRRMKEGATAAGHRKAVRSINTRMGELLSALANVRAVKGYRFEAVRLALRAYLSDPSAVPRAAKVALLMLGWTPKQPVRAGV